MFRSSVIVMWMVGSTACVMGPQGSGVAETETRDADGAAGFENRTFVDVAVRIDAAGPAMALTCDDNLLDELVTEVVDGVLVLRNRSMNLPMPLTQCVATVWLPEAHTLRGAGSGQTVLVDPAIGLREVAVSGSGALSLAAPATGLTQLSSSGSGAFEAVGLQGCTVAMQHSGSGAVVVHDLQVCALDLLQSGSGSTRLSGAADSAALHLTGSGDFGDRSFEVDFASLSNTGSGRTELTVNEAVEIRLSGSGGVEVYGGPSVEVLVETGSGRAVVR